MKKIRLGIIGCGAMGSEIARACSKRLKDRFSLYAICDIDKKKAAALKDTLASSVLILDLNIMIKKADFIVEAASASISAKVLENCVRHKRDCLIMSVGGLVGKEKLLEDANRKSVRVYLPSGALCGIDGLKSASCGAIESVTLTTRKPPKGLAGAPYLSQKNIDVSALREETVIFEGSAEDAVKGFPQNVNVSAVLSLAGIGAKKTRVRIVACPASAVNSHEVEVSGEFGRIAAKTENAPSKTNPKTSALAIFSAIATLEAAAKSVRIGT